MTAQFFVCALRVGLRKLLHCALKLEQHWQFSQSEIYLKFLNLLCCYIMLCYGVIQQKPIYAKLIRLIVH